MDEQYYIAALPKLSIEFYQAVEDVLRLPCYPEIRLPFHSTLYYLGNLTAQQKSSVIDWLRALELKAFTTKVVGVSFFQTGSVRHTCYLHLDSVYLNELNEQMANAFSHIHKDKFSFLPHLSICFPKLAITHEQVQKLEEIFSTVRDLDFRSIYLGSVIENVTRINTQFMLK